MRRTRCSVYVLRIGFDWYTIPHTDWELDEDGIFHFLSVLCIYTTWTFNMKHIATMHTQISTEYRTHTAVLICSYLNERLSMFVCAEFSVLHINNKINSFLWVSHSKMHPPFRIHSAHCSLIQFWLGVEQKGKNEQCFSFTCWMQCDTKGQSYDHDCEIPAFDSQ